MRGSPGGSITFLTVIAPAAPQSISKEIPEASLLDGAGFFNRLRHVVIPMVRNALLVAPLPGSVRFLQGTTMPPVPTRGGPTNATMVLSPFTYRLAFENWDFALAATARAPWTAFPMFVAWLLPNFGLRKEYGR